MTLSIKGLFVTLSMNDTEHDNAQNYAHCHYARTRVLFIAMLNVIILSFVMLNVVALIVVNIVELVRFVIINTPSLNCPANLSRLLL